MKITKKQQEEIDFYKRTYNINPTDKEIEDFINHTVYGKKSKNFKELVYSNKKNLFNCKRWLDMTVKMWTEDFKKGWSSPKWLLDDETDPFVRKLIKSAGKSIKRSDVMNIINKHL